MSVKVKFVLVSILHIISKFINLKDKVKDLKTMFNIPCEVKDFYVVSRIVAKQFSLDFNNLIICLNGEVYGSNVFDIGGKEYAEPLRYILINGFNIKGRNAFRLAFILYRSNGVGVIKDSKGVKVLYTV